MRRLVKNWIVSLLLVLNTHELLIMNVKHKLLRGAIPLQNPTGLAVGGIITAQGVTYVVLPGPPSELKPMVNQELIPALY